MKVNNTGSNTFDVYIKVSKNGTCTISVSSLKIDNVNYSGYLVPIPDTTNPATEVGNPI
jgi:hypothetical protein